jgi:NADPH:quinone reductase-like Zn-dependent oxidoreductase
MKAIFYKAYGSPDVLELGNFITPEAGPGEVRVRMIAAGVSPIDAKLRAGELKAHFALAFPKIPGRDGMGVVDQLGAGVTEHALGDHVCVMSDPVDPSGRGTYAEAVVCTTARVVAKPPNLTNLQAAALLQPGMSAWIAVMRTARVVPGMRVLVHGGSGAVGCLMVQLLTHLGCRVTSTCRAENLDYTAAMGAESVIAYDRDDFGTLKEMDLVFDLIGGETHRRSYPVLKHGGQLVYLTAQPFVDQAATYGVSVDRALINDAPDALQAVVRMAREGIFKPGVAGVRDLAEAAQAHRDFEAGKITRGRVVLRIDA